MFAFSYYNLQIYNNSTGRIDGTSGTSTNRRYSVAALVTFSCNEGHTLEGEASIVCTETGLWSHSPPYCKILNKIVVLLFITYIIYGHVRRLLTYISYIIS